MVIGTPLPGRDDGAGRVPVGDVDVVAGEARDRVARVDEFERQALFLEESFLDAELHAEAGHARMAGVAHGLQASAAGAGAAARVVSGSLREQAANTAARPITVMRVQRVRDVFFMGR